MDAIKSLQENKTTMTRSLLGFYWTY